MRDGLNHPSFSIHSHIPRSTVFDLAYIGDIPGPIFGRT